MPTLEKFISDSTMEKLIGSVEPWSWDKGQNVVWKEERQPTTPSKQTLTQTEIENIFRYIDGKSVAEHKKVVKEMKWVDCIHPLSILTKPNPGECYGFYNFGKDGRFLHYERDNKHYYVVALYKKEYIKKTDEKIANQETLVPTKYYVVGSDRTCFWPCGEDLYSEWNMGVHYYKKWDTIISNEGLKKYVDREIFLLELKEISASMNFDISLGDEYDEDDWPI